MTGGVGYRLREEGSGWESKGEPRGKLGVMFLCEREGMTRGGFQPHLLIFSPTSDQPVSLVLSFHVRSTLEP